MIVVISHHWCKPNREDEARARIDKSGDAMAPAPGFLFRYRIEPATDPNKVSTMTVWTDEAAFRAYRTARPSPSTADDAVPYARVETEVFEVRRTHGDAPA